MTDIIERLREQMPVNTTLVVCHLLDEARSERTDLQNTIIRLTRELGAARDAEAAAIVDWLADDASQTDSDLRGLHRRKLLTPKQTLEWEAQIAAKSGVAAAIARHEHRKD